MTASPPELLTPPPQYSYLQDGFQAGFNLAHLHRRGIGYGSPASMRQLQRLRGLGVTHVALTPFGYVDNVQTTDIWYGSRLDRSLTDEDLLKEAQQAREVGLSVCIKPHIWSRAFWTSGKSRQDIRPDRWDEWFEHYTGFIKHYARVAETAKAELLCVGLEYLQATQDNPGAWGAVADACRTVYTGKLTYAANWWEEVDAFADWSSYDFIGVNAYYPLSEAPDPSAQALKAAWTPHLRHLKGLSQKNDRPLLFMEAGYRSITGSVEEPWSTSRNGAPNDALQAKAYSALLAAAAENADWLKGIYWWKWFTDDNGREREDYCPMNKPAEDVLKQWWRDAGE
ncbi:MAG: hypothetical protein AAFV53_03630 [Myxococcota bacterium]